ncbi:ATP-binding protein/SpoIIE family protein phosphatase [Streptomyces sp. NBC_01341]|uniref:ATP-binding SpoIIE family protein phosphatase n=1 Tax=Streptomyces sp. NBC_01341 TaxID=2903831 RepID=UPI002E1351D7|nr:ATP-binding protein/SpoIIE family protein phosphatase [Streptomyces sp. NBC_01341]
MGSLTPPLLESEDVAWFRDDESLPASTRGAAAALARRLGFDEQRCAEVSLAVSEAATNLRKHAVDGALLLRIVRTEQDAGLEIVTTDEGPGMPDVARCLVDGTSSTGTLGIGLGAIARLADTFDVHSLPGRGTVLSARFWTKDAARRSAALGEPVVAGLTRPITGEVVCGDIWAARTVGRRTPDQADEAIRRVGSRPAEPLGWAALTGFRPAPDRPRQVREAPEPTGHAEGPALLLMFCDGLGHGPLARRASEAAATAFRESRTDDPAGVITEIHKALRGSRGGAVAVVRIEPLTKSLLFCGVGNVSTFVVDSETDSRRSLLSAPGIVGHQLPNLRAVRQELPRHGGVVMHSDGLTERWQPASLPGFLEHSPLVAAAQLLREAGIRRDDAGVAVVKGPW